MLVEFSIYPLGEGSHIREEIAEVLKVIDVSGLAYQLTATSTIVEGEWAEVMRFVYTCHERLRERSDYVVTFIKIEDQNNETRQLVHNVGAVEEALGRDLNLHPEDSHDPRRR
jgi:uncharacterized protein (TIGR00106 family)